MANILFVHGTGVRADSLNATMDEIARQIRGWATAEEPCAWGESEGTSLRAGGASVPSFDATRAVAREEFPDDMESGWVFLLADPLAELRLLAIRTEDKGVDDIELYPGVGAELEAAFKGLPEISKPVSGETCQVLTPTSPVEKLASAVNAVRLQDTFNEARQWVAQSSAFQAAMKGAEEPLGDYREALARAVVARAVLLEEGISPEERLSPDDRDRLVAAFVEALGGGYRGLLGRIGGQAVALAAAVGASIGTTGLKRYRGRVTEGLALQVGDVLLYQARGADIRNAIAGCLAAAKESVILFAHSLGGIAAVELLIQDRSARCKVKLLVTAGSQFSFLYELGALETLPYPSSLPARGQFPPWLNFFDMSDFLSYVAQADLLFGDLVQDVQVFSRLRFPDSHGWYMKSPEVWKKIREVVERIDQSMGGGGHDRLDA